MNTEKIIFSVAGFTQKSDAETWAKKLNRANAKNGMPTNWHAIFQNGFWRVGRFTEHEGK